MKQYDIIIIGSGISGLYAAYKIKKTSPNTSFLILEKNNKKYIGGRMGNDTFYGIQIVTGAGIGRKNKDKLLYKLLKIFNLNTSQYISKPYYSNLINKIDIIKIINKLKKEYKKQSKSNNKLTFKQFAIKIIGKKEYKNFILSSGYSDYENEDIYETLYHYGMDDNKCCLKSFSVPWQKLVLKLYNYIGKNNFKFSNKVINIKKINNESCNKSCNFIIKTNNEKYYCNKVIIASTIDCIRSLLPNKIYKDIEGQPFLRLYAKFNKDSIPILQKYVKDYTFLTGHLQKIIPINPEKGIYMIAYNDNKNALTLKKYLKNNKKNRKIFQKLVEKSLGIQNNSLKIIGMKDYYWSIGTHYYKPLNTNEYKNREEFIYKAQHPDKCMLVIGEAVSRKQGWTEGALESVQTVLNKNWIEN